MFVLDNILIQYLCPRRLTVHISIREIIKTSSISNLNDLANFMARLLGQVTACPRPGPAWSVWRPNSYSENRYGEEMPSHNGQMLFK